MTRRNVSIAELKTAGPGEILVTLGIGSCVVVAIYERDRKIGSLAHIMMPYKSFGRRREGENMNKYADIAIPEAVDSLKKLGGKHSAMTAKIAGGSHMFDISRDGQPDIGQRNVDAVKSILESLRIPLVAEETGGNRGRSVEFRIDTGELMVRTIRGGERII